MIRKHHDQFHNDLVDKQNETFKKLAHILTHESLFWGEALVVTNCPDWTPLPSSTNSSWVTTPRVPYHCTRVAAASSGEEKTPFHSVEKRVSATRHTKRWARPIFLSSDDPIPFYISPVVVILYYAQQAEGNIIKARVSLYSSTYSGLCDLLLTTWMMVYNAKKNVIWFVYLNFLSGVSPGK